MPCGCLHGQTPLQVSQNHAFDDPRADGQFAERIRRRLSCKRERRATPVKERAVKVGVVLPPTPSGVREATKSGTPVAQREARRKLQRHQQACQQRVASAEEKADVGCSVSGVAARHRALHAANQARHHARKKAVRPRRAQISVPFVNSSLFNGPPPHAGTAAGPELLSKRPMAAASAQSSAAKRRRRRRRSELMVMMMMSPAASKIDISGPKGNFPFAVAYFQFGPNRGGRRAASRRLASMAVAFISSTTLKKTYHNISPY